MRGPSAAVRATRSGHRAADNVQRTTCNSQCSADNTERTSSLIVAAAAAAASCAMPTTRHLGHVLTRCELSCVRARACVRSRLLLERAHKVATCKHATCNRQQTTCNMQQVRTSRVRQPTAGLRRSSARHPAAKRHTTDDRQHATRGKDTPSSPLPPTDTQSPQAAADSKPRRHRGTVRLHLPVQRSRVLEGTRGVLLAYCGLGDTNGRRRSARGVTAARARALAGASRPRASTAPPPRPSLQLPPPRPSWQLPPPRPSWQLPPPRPSWQLPPPRPSWLSPPPRPSWLSPPPRPSWLSPPPRPSWQLPPPRPSWRTLPPPRPSWRTPLPSWPSWQLPPPTGRMWAVGECCESGGGRGGKRGQGAVRGGGGEKHFIEAKQACKMSACSQHLLSLAAQRPLDTARTACV